MTALAVGLFSTEMQASNASDAADAAARGQEQQVQLAKNAQADADIANNKANQNKPDVAGILASNANAGKAGPSSTLLTGSQGIDPTKLNLGKSTLLGG
jgi:hypothetical protein